MSDADLIREVHELKKTIEGFMPSGPCPLHQELSREISGMAKTVAVLPETMAGLSKEFKFVGSEMDRRTTVLFGVTEKLDLKLQAHDREILLLKTNPRPESKPEKAEGKEVRAIDGRLRFLEEWRWKLVGATSFLIVLVGVAEKVYSVWKGH